MYCYLKYIVYDKLLKPQQSFRITLYIRSTNIYRYIHTCITHTYIHTCMHAYIHTYMYIYTYIHLYIHLHSYVHACIAYMCTYTYILTYTYVHTYIYAYIYTYAVYIYRPGCLLPYKFREFNKYNKFSSQNFLILQINSLSAPKNGWLSLQECWNILVITHSF